MNKQMRLLIVDDRQDNLLILGSLVREYFPAVEIFTASSAEEGIVVAMEQQIDGVIVDVQMPGMNGIEMCRQLKSNPHTAQSALILITAHRTDPKLKADGLEAGADDFIIRPFDNVEFVARVKVMLRIKKAENDLREMNQNLEERVADKIWALRASEERLRQISENSREWIWEVDVKGVYTYSSPSVNFLGYTTEEIVGKKSFFDFFPPSCREELKAAAFKVFETKQPFHDFIKPTTDKTGEIFWLSTSAVPILDQNGDLLGYRGAGQNVTERKKTEDLHAAQIRLIDYSASHTIPELLEQFLAEAEALTASEIGFYHFVEDDQETLNLQVWSKNTVEKMFNQEITDRHYPISQAGVWVDCIYARKPVIHNDYASLPYKKGLPEGHASIVRDLVVPVIRNGKIKAVLGVGNKKSNYTPGDVSAIQRLADVSWETIVAKRTEAERELLMSAVGQAEEAIVITDRAGSIQYVNPAYGQITGYSLAEALGQNPRILSSGKTSPAVYKEMWRRLLAGESWRGRFYNKKKDGSLYTEEAVISPVINTAGETTHYVAVKTDITHALELEDQLRQSQKIQAVGQLAGGIAHDFNNILTVILGYGQLICRRLSPEDKTCRDINTMIVAAKKGESLTRQLLAFSRRQVLESTTIDLNLLVTEFKDLLAKLLRENIELKLCLSDLPVLVEADPTQTEQILVNLVVNARDAIGDKEGVISIEVVTSDLPSREKYPFLPKSRKSFGRIMVVDSGCGIAPEIKDKIFDPFFTTKGLGQGTGLGLSTVYGIVKQSEGYLFVDSVPGEGTNFSVYLPIGSEGSETETSQDTASPLNKAPKTILVIDDEEDVLSILEQVLEHVGHTVFAQNDPLEALDLWVEKKDEFDLVITDIGMPGMNGVDLANRILAIKDDMQILFISGYGELHTRENASAPKDFNFLQKPFSPGDILKKIDEIFYP